MSLKQTKVKKPKRSPSQKKIYMRERSRLYYQIPKNKEAQILKMRERKSKNRSGINERYARTCRMKTFEQRLRKIWIGRGLIIGKV